MNRHADFPRRVLAIAVGMTPQVVTETLYALAVQAEEKFVPTEICIITTAEGAARIHADLLDPQRGQFHALCREYGLEGRIQFDADSIEVLAGPDGPLQDIRTPAENVLAADAITAFVRRLCADPLAAVQVSIAGGRKSMGYYLGYALSLFGRAQDGLSHVLVNAPFETNRAFFFPPIQPRLLTLADGRQVSTAEARVEWAEIPFVRLREGLPAALLAGEGSFSATVEAATQRFVPVALSFDLPRGLLVAAGQQVKLPPSLLAWYALLARAMLRGWGRQGAVRCTDIEPAELLRVYAACVNRHGEAYEKLESILKKEQGVPTELFDERSSKLKRELKVALGPMAEPYLPVRRGSRGQARQLLALKPTQISGID